MEILHAIILGLVQGLAEFLPISSSAHLIIVPWLLHWNDPGLGFDVALHMGTLLGVLIYFWQDIWLIIKGFFHSLSGSTRDLQNNIYQKLAWMLILATIPGAILGKLLEKQADQAFRAPLLIAGTMFIGGLILLVADIVGKKVKNLNHFGFSSALTMGLAQALAVVPGISRSGISIASGLFLGFTKEDAAKFSFLMSVPLIFGAGVLEVKHFHDGITTAQLVFGFLSSALFGFLAIKYMLRYIAKHDYKIFAWYRFALCILILVVFYLRK